MPATLDPRKAYTTRQHGDLVVVFTWVNDERAMVLLPAFRPGAPWYIVCDSTAWRYDDPAYLARQCVTACYVLGIEPPKFDTLPACRTLLRARTSCPVNRLEASDRASERTFVVVTA